MYANKINVMGKRKVRRNTSNKNGLCDAIFHLRFTYSNLQTTLKIDQNDIIKLDLV